MHGIIYQTNNSVQEITKYIENNVGDFVYKDGVLDVSSDTPIITENTSLGKIIIDTKITTEEEKNKYINSIEDGMGIIILKENIIIKGLAGSGTISYNYKDLFNQIDITEFTKQNVIDLVNSSTIWNFYLSLFLMVLVYAIIMYVISILWNAVIISIFGYIATWLAKIKMRYAAIFNMSVYALTLSVILNAIYVAVNIFIDFDIKYFQLMYITVASIYLIAAIFIIKSEFIKKQIEVTRIVMEQQKIAKEKEEQEEKNPEENDKKQNQDKDKKQDGDKEQSGDKDKQQGKRQGKKQNEKQNGEAPEGSQA